VTCEFECCEASCIYLLFPNSASIRALLSSSRQSSEPPRGRSSSQVRLNWLFVNELGKTRSFPDTAVQISRNSPSEVKICFSGRWEFISQDSVQRCSCDRRSTVVRSTVGRPARDRSKASARRMFSAVSLLSTRTDIAKRCRRRRVPLAGCRRGGLERSRAPPPCSYAQRRQWRVGFHGGATAYSTAAGGAGHVLRLTRFAC
jgi:hypothetical protein